MGNGGEKRGESSASLVIERTTPRVVFAQLVAQALCEVRVRPSPMATSYLIDLLTSHVRFREGAPDAPGEFSESDSTLTEALFAARSADGALRIERLRDLGDRALFVSGFFGDSLNRRVVGLDFYLDVGRIAYSDLASHLDGCLSERVWTELYGELSEGFRDFIDILAEVSDQALGSRSENLLRLYDRYSRTQSPRDRARLARLGCTLPTRGSGGSGGGYPN